LEGWDIGNDLENNKGNDGGNDKNKIVNYDNELLKLIKRLVLPIKNENMKIIMGVLKDLLIKILGVNYKEFDIKKVEFDYDFKIGKYKT
jgi:hypothetical protein